MCFDPQQIENNVDRVVVLLKAISNEKRLLILCALSHDEKSVGVLEEKVGISQSALSQHLARLRRDGIVKTRREAQTIYYSVCDKSVVGLLGYLCHMLHA